MYRRPSSAPAWILAAGGRFLMAPITKPMLRAARLAAATVDVEDADRPFALEEAGDALSRALIVAGMQDWGDMVDDATGEPIAFSAEELELSLADPVFFDALDAAYVLPYYARVAEKNGSSPSQTGTGGATTPANPTVEIAPDGAATAPTSSTPRKAKPARGSGKR